MIINHSEIPCRIEVAVKEKTGQTSITITQATQILCNLINSDVVRVGVHGKLTDSISK